MCLMLNTYVHSLIQNTAHMIFINEKRKICKYVKVIYNNKEWIKLPWWWISIRVHVTERKYRINQRKEYKKTQTKQSNKKEKKTQKLTQQYTCVHKELIIITRHSFAAATLQ